MPTRPLPAAALFGGTVLAFLYGASHPCAFLSLALLALLALAVVATAIVYFEDLRKTLILSFGLLQPEEPTFLQYCQRHHPLYSCFFASAAGDQWLGRPQRLVLYATSLWLMFMWSLYAEGKFPSPAADAVEAPEKCHYWTTVVGLLVVPRVSVLFLTSMISFAQAWDDTALIDRVEERVDMLAPGAPARRRELASEHITCCLLAVKNGVLASFCIAVYTLSLLGLASASRHSSLYVCLVFLFQFGLATGLDTLHAFLVYYYSAEYGVLPYLQDPRTTPGDRYYTDDGGIDDVDCQNAIHDEIGL